MSSRENRLAGNWRGIVHDTELWARFDLVRGRPSSAVDRLAKARAEFEARGVAWRSVQLAALRARALGWLGRQEEAAAELAAVSDEALSEFEPEERPALWALAGGYDRALAGIDADDPAASVWTAILNGQAPTDDDWKALAFDDEYRMARLVLDIGFVAEEFVPPQLAHRAVVVLQRLGAEVLAERLERSSAGSWEAVAAYLDEGVTGAGGLAKLFANGGYGEARLVRRSEGVDEILVDGAGGQSEISEKLGSSELVLSSSWIDPALRVMFRLVVRDLEHDLQSTEPTASRHSPRFGMIGESRALGDAMGRLAQLAAEDVPLLLLGETGTGKELAARRGHMMSPRSGGPFLPINCAAVSEDLLMSDLFGHVRGAYTGAVRDRIGVFETARGGTVFLDEIGDLPLRAQGFLLRVLQENEVRRVGESLSRPTDARVITATHRDLEAMVRDGDFRADLYYRLRVALVELPPLRHRDGDVILLAEHFIRRMRPSRTPRIGRAARTALLGHQWPGNVRELENVLSVAVAMVSEGSLQPEHLELPCRGGESDRGYHEEVLNFRRRLVRNALDGSGGNRAEAARALGLTRQALSYLVRKLEIDL